MNLIRFSVPYQSNEICHGNGDASESTALPI